MTGNGLTERQELEGDICQYLFDEFCATFSFRFGGDKYELVGSEEVPGLADNQLILRRERDGKLYEVDLGADVYEFEPKAAS